MQLESAADLDIGKGAFCRRFPNSVVRDRRLNCKGLVLIAYRATFADQRRAFGLNEKALRRCRIVHSGLGKNGIHQGLANAIEAGYMERAQIGRAVKGRFKRAQDSLKLPNCGKSGNAGRHVRREWFDGRLSDKEMAAFLFFRAEGQLYASALAKRFGWARQTAGKVIASLCRLGLAAKHVSRKKGKIAGVAYKVLPPVLWSNGATVKKQGDGLQGHGFSGDTHTTTPHVLPTGESSSRTLASARGSCTSRGREGATADFGETLSSPNLLGWIESTGLECPEPDEDIVRAIWAVADNTELRRRVRQAAAKRVSKEVVSLSGLWAIRILAAFVLEDPCADRTPDEALEYVLEAIRHRVGDRPDTWLNSLALIGMRILGPATGGNGVDERAYASAGKEQSKPVAPHLARCLAELKERDGAKLLHPCLYQDPQGFEALIREYGTEALETIHAYLWDAMAVGTEMHKVRSCGSISMDRLRTSGTPLSLPPPA